MFEKELFEDKVRKSNKTIAETARFLGINRSTLYRKINQTADFTRDEMIKLKVYLDLSLQEFMEVFYGRKVA
ncbi:MAG: XRE family transcriptional regulator [Clostridia bacterium]|nr:XRE family transcriptional regulator [Clostridia bacterium]